MKKIILFNLILIICILSISKLQAREFPMQNRLGIGLNYPGISAKYWLKRFCFEVKRQFGEGIQLYGLRIYKAIYKKFNPLLYIGAEGDYVSFKGEESKGSGIAIEVFVGGEIFIKNSLSINIDIGPSYIGLKDKDTSIAQSGFDIIANIGVNYYFGSKK